MSKKVSWKMTPKCAFFVKNDPKMCLFYEKWEKKFSFSWKMRKKFSILWKMSQKISVTCTSLLSWAQFDYMYWVGIKNCDLCGQSSIHYNSLWRVHEEIMLLTCNSGQGPPFGSDNVKYWCFVRCPFWFTSTSLRLQV